MSQSPIARIAAHFGCDLNIGRKIPMQKAEVIATIKALAESNGGVPVGRTRLLQEGGITEGQYSKFGTLGELQTEAGYTPNALNGAIDEEEILSQLVDLSSLLGEFPTIQKMRAAREKYPQRFPSHNTFTRLGSTKAAKASAVVAWLSGKENPTTEESLALKICRPLAIEFEKETAVPDAIFEACGYVYLFRDSTAHKIGSSIDPASRRLTLQTGNPRAIQLVHQIITDDPKGIEDYWHRRFAARRRLAAGGTEWFDLRKEDIAIFRSRTRM
jgi:hypothetical protein